MTPGPENPAIPMRDPAYGKILYDDVNTLYAAVGVDWYVEDGTQPGENDPVSNPELTKHEYGEVVGTAKKSKKK
jgi:hypothetical protein